jgi:hypothetical protein
MRLMTYCFRRLMLTYADVCWQMLRMTYCFRRRMLTYADVCWQMRRMTYCFRRRMLTYADVCWQMRRMTYCFRTTSLGAALRSSIRYKSTNTRAQKYKYSRTKVQILTHKSTNTDALPCKAVWTDASRAVGAVDLTGNPKPWHPESLGNRVDPIDKGNYWPLFLEWSVACFTCVTSTQVYLLY